MFIVSGRRSARPERLLCFALSLEPPEPVTNQENSEITKPRQPRQERLYSFCYLLSVVRVKNLNASPNIFSIIIFGNRALSSRLQTLPALLINNTVSPTRAYDLKTCFSACLAGYFYPVTHLVTSEA